MDEKKRILFIDNGKEFGGGTRSFLYLLEEICKENLYEIYVYFENNYPVGDENIRQICAKLGAKIINFKPKPKFSKLKKEIIRLFSKKLLQQKLYEFELKFANQLFLDFVPDLVHLNNSFASNLHYIEAANTHNIEVVQHLRSNNALDDFVLSKLKNLKFKAICVSNSTYNFYLKYLKFDKFVVYNPVSIENCDIKQNQSDKINIIMPANFLNRKGHDLVFDAFLELKRDDVRLFLAGDGEFKGENKEKFHNLIQKGVVVNLGFVSKMSEIYNNYDYVLGFSVAEGLPRVVIEGLGYGCGIIYANLPVISEIREICDNKDRFFIVKRDTNSLKICLENLPKISAKRQDQAVINTFSLQNYVREILKFYKEIFALQI